MLDGIVTKREMLAYQDPKHPYRASKEAQKIIDTADTDGDGMLQVEELIKVSNEYSYTIYISNIKKIMKKHNQVYLNKINVF